MYLVPVILLATLVVVVYAGNSMKKKGSMTESAYQSLVSVASVTVTAAALVTMYLRLKG